MGYNTIIGGNKCTSLVVELPVFLEVLRHVSLYHFPAKNFQQFQGYKVKSTHFEFKYSDKTLHIDLHQEMHQN